MHKLAANNTQIFYTNLDVNGPLLFDERLSSPLHAHNSQPQVASDSKSRHQCTALLGH